MRKFIFLLILQFVLFSSIDAQTYCCPCLRDRYHNVLKVGDAWYYGYMDNINYPDPYNLPVNIYFNYCPPCRCNSYNAQYLQRCIRYTNGSSRVYNSPPSSSYYRNQ